ncbi:MAG: hypothetical protein ACXAEN_08235 [Candidatus Thorarchaeota archaeon]
MTTSSPLPREQRRSGLSSLTLVNLLLRESVHKVRILEIDAKLSDDPELFVVTRIVWRDPDRLKPVLHQLPKILSILETLRGTRGIPSEVYLNSTEGIVVYLPSGVTVSQLPITSREAVTVLMDLVEGTVNHTLSTITEVENWFWRAARQKGFSPDIVERMGRKEPHYDTPHLLKEYHGILRKYFSLRFTVHKAESCLRLETGQ